MVGIYKLTNTINNLIYIGQTVNFKRRINEYKNRTPIKSSNYKIIKAINKYGFNNFSYELIIECDVNELDQYEMYFIEKFKSYNPNIGYNSMHIEQDGKYHINKETKEKMSKSHYGKKQSSHTKKLRSNKIIAFKNNDIIIADSAKLFGDYINKSKDIIKNGLRKPVKVCGYMIFYADSIKRNEILNKQKTKKVRNKEYIKISEMLDCESVETKFSNCNIKYITY